MVSSQKLKIVLEGLSSQLTLLNCIINTLSPKSSTTARENNSCAKCIRLLKYFYLFQHQLHQGFHPFWGYQRCWAYLYFRHDIKVNKNRIYHLIKEHELSVTQKRYQSISKSSHPKPKSSYPNPIWGTDRIKIKIGIWGWYYLVIVLDWFTRKIIIYHLSFQSKSRDWQEALK